MYLLFLKQNYKKKILSRLIEVFEDNKLENKIKERLPYLFQLAELESSRAGKIGMEVGTVRERIVVALLIYKFGESNVETEIPITEPEIDALLFEKALSIKTITGKSLSGVKLIWTVDPQKAKEFRKNYNPHCDIVLVQINWNDVGGLFFIPLEVQEKLFKKLGRRKYIKLPKPGTNPRGVEIAKEALEKLVYDNNTMSIKIEWKRTKIEFNPYKRWIELWKED